MTIIAIQNMSNIACLPENPKVNNAGHPKNYTKLQPPEPCKENGACHCMLVILWHSQRRYDFTFSFSVTLIFGLFIPKLHNNLQV